MLVLARRPGETIVINGNIRVTVLSVEGERVRLGIDAPRSIPVVRQELHDAVRAENLQAARTPLSPDLLRRIGDAIRPTTAPRG
ncbi:MAG: carbon storage regulator CsrA [Sphaerobacter sp.]|nr:carbon storage regulator CsrA [Sphaerobacter sp.]